MSRLLRQIIPESVAIESKILPAMIDGDATQMRQVIMNLIKNAADAVQNAPSSQILLETGVCRFDPSSVRGHLLPDRLPAGDYAFVRVTDNGCGISSETIDKIFDPFFSTKSNGQGLGLAAALGIVRGHDGAILVESQVNHGTTFQVLIPANQKLALRRPSTRRSSLAQGARVLTIDDEPKICELVSEILGNANLQVQTVSQPHRALSMIANAEPPYELIVMDLRMEEMPGEETLRRIRAICQTPVVIISGCGEKEIEARLQGQVVEGILNKPFSAQELVQVVRGVLANQPTVT